ncbi:MAG: Spy/CpxP family protein refolding chaperone, partial [Phycisphaerae bacterium]|nr:Spy/CpxP family protein refolding chaperone [Phycisphaerae bacterium]
MKKTRLCMLIALLAAAAMLIGNLFGGDGDFGFSRSALAAKSMAKGKVPTPKKAKRPAVRHPAKPAGPDIIVIVFKEIPAQSFLHTMHQLREQEKGLSAIKVAINEPANAVVILGPREIVAKMARVAKSLDVPNKFREKTRRIEMRERKLKQDMERKRPGQERRTDARRGPATHRPGARPLAAAPAMLLMNPKVRQELKLSGKQAERINQIVKAQMRRGLEQFARLGAEMKKQVKPKQRAAIAKKLQAARKQFGARMQKGREQVLHVLTPEQRKKLEQVGQRMRRKGGQAMVKRKRAAGKAHKAKAERRKPKPKADRKKGEAKAKDRKARGAKAKGRKARGGKAKGASARKSALRPGPMLALAPRVRREFGLNEGQVGKISKIVKGHMNEGREQMQRLTAQMRETKDREKRARIAKRIAELREARMRNCRKAAMRVLNQKQREQFERIEVRVREQARKGAQQRRRTRQKKERA